jgi:hypothetical protein
MVERRRQNFAARAAKIAGQAMANVMIAATQLHASTTWEIVMLEIWLRKIFNA